MRLKPILVVLMALMFLTTNLFIVTFSKSVLAKETKIVHDGENPRTAQATFGDSTLNQKELSKASNFSVAKPEENLAKSRSPNIFLSESFVKDTSTDKTDMWRDFAKVDEDSAELVIGINNAQPDSHIEIGALIVENGGKLVNTVSAKSEVIAVVADLPLDLVPSFVEDVQASNLARYIEPNTRYQTQLVPNDLYWVLQWGPVKIEADYAWNTTVGDPSVLVAVIDTGIDHDHPDIVANYIPLGYDWVNNDTDPMDDYGHGTHCAGIIAAELNNGIGIAGVAQVSIMAEKGLDQYGWGDEDDLANAIIHAVDQGADILSNSWGGYDESILIYDAVKYAYNSGVLVIAAAGNDASRNKLYPAAYDEVIAVTATDLLDDPAIFTNFGQWVEVAAPGVRIYSTYWDNAYTYSSGTSMSTPHVSGVAALIWSQFPNMTRDWVRAQLRYAADDLGDPSFDNYYGYGRINARKAVEQAPLDHDLLIFDWERPQHVQPGDLVTFNSTILNFGVNDESDITVQLLVDSSVVDSAPIGFLASGTSAIVSGLWNATFEGIHNVTAWVVPVPGENNTVNNAIQAFIKVKFIETALFKNVDPWGYPTNEEVLSLNGIPYTVFNSKDFGLVNLTSYSKVIIASDQDQSFYYDMEAYRSWFEDYVSSGGMLEIHAADLGWNGGEWIGTLPGELVWNSDYAQYVTIVDPAHPVVNIPNPITDTELDNWNLAVHGYFISYPPNSHIVITEDSTGYPAYLEFDYGAGTIVASSQTLEWGYMHGYSLILENSLLYTAVRYPHELTVYLEAPVYLEPDHSSLLNATVYNIGLNNETDVELQLLIDGSIVDSVVIPELENGSTFTLSYLWTPLTEATYNVTAYAAPVPGEEIEYNNKITTFVTVTYPLIRPMEGQWANYTLNYYDPTGQIIGTGYWNITYDHYVEPYMIYVTMWITDPSGYNGTNWMIVNIMNRWVESGMWAGLWYPGWIETNINLGSTINLLDGTATVNGSRIIPVDIHPIDCWELSYWMYEYQYTLWYDKASGLWIDMEYVEPYYNQRFELLLVDTNIPIGTTYEHELAATLEAPHFLEPSNSSLLNATVYNLGLSNETNVELQLLINGTQADSVTIPELLNGTSYTISHLWTPAMEAIYNVTAFALPVLGENITINNVATQLVKVRTVKGYVLFDQTHWTDSIFYYNTWVTDLIDGGYMVDTLTTSPIAQSMLEGYDVFVIPQAHDYYFPDEILAIRNFVLDGGGLLVIGDDSPFIYTTLTSFADITWSGESYGWWGHTSDITPHPVTEGVTTAYFGSPMSQMYVSSPAIDLIQDGYGYGEIMLAASEVGLGAVIGIADENSIINYDIDYADNRRLANNMIDWLTSRPPVPSFTYSPLDPYVGETVTFDASYSYDPDGTIVSYIWDFGDDTSGEGNITTHFYAAGGIYTVALTVVDNENLTSTSTTEITISRTTLDIEVEVGSIHFRGEMAEFYILVSCLGSPVDANINATLYYNETLYENLTDDINPIITGFYRIPYTIPTDASPGTYALIVEANYLSLEGVSLQSFLLSPTLTGWNALLIDINGTVGTLKTDLGSIEVKLDAINATLKSIEGRIGTIETDIGTIKTDVSVINATLKSIEGRIAIIESDLGTIKTDITSINGSLTSIEGNVATIETEIGTIKTDTNSINANIIAMNGTLVTIQTDIGSTQTNISSINARLTALDGTLATIQTEISTITGTITSILGDIATIETDIGTIEATLEGWTGGTTSLIITPEDTFRILVLTTSSLDGPITFSDNVVGMTLSGTSGTTGTTNIVIPKQLLVGIESSIGEVVVTVDDEQVVYSYTEQSDEYVLTITYTYSTHMMKIYLTGLPPAPVSWALYVIATAIIVLAVSASLAIYILKIRKPRVAKTK